MMGSRMSRDLLHDRVHDCRGTYHMMGSRLPRDCLHDRVHCCRGTVYMMGCNVVAGLTA